MIIRRSSFTTNIVSFVTRHPLAEVMSLGRSVVPIEETHHINDLSTSNCATLLWHYRLGHLNHQTMVHMDRQHIALGFTLPHKSKLSLCEGCIFGKLSNLPFPSHPTTTTKPLQVLHIDICGP